MTKEQLNEIASDLAKWREERRLTTGDQRKGFYGNILEEITEFERATSDDDMCDALCDVITFSINTLEIDDVKCPSRCENFKDLPFSCIPFRKDEARGELLEPLINYELPVLAQDLIYTACYYLEVLGYDPYKCMKETIKELNSRSGEYDDKMKKFVKDKGMYIEDIEKFKKSMSVVMENSEWITLSDGAETITYRKWYRARYASCKR